MIHSGAQLHDLQEPRPSGGQPHGPGVPALEPVQRAIPEADTEVSGRLVKHQRDPRAVAVGPKHVGRSDVLVVLENKISVRKKLNLIFSIRTTGVIVCV